MLSVVAPRLRQFAVVAREQHVTRAAERLGLAQSTLSRNIARLEADLGTTLLLRTGRTVRLTRHGQQLLPHVERALVALTDGLDELTEELSPDRGRVAFAFLHSLGVRAVPVLLRDFRTSHPRVRFTLVQDSNDAMLEKLRSGAVDLCLTSPVPEDPVFRARKVDQQRLGLVVPHGHRLAGRKRVGLAEAAEEEFVGLKRGYGLRRITDDWCRQAGFTPRLAFEGEEIDTVLGLVAAGLGVALLPLGPAAHHDVVRVTVTHPQTTRTVALVWLADRAYAPPVEAFRASVLSYRGRLLAAQ
ncbi:LysR family transcriptional regulator [Micromonospora deserti]|uniref:LysR family transcriptional regulator n=1 Tax=Micromonospora deserti TaxID=2070366 RepID=A0A2W2CEU7_9ACTN|nr:LysR family transcriptional regulator [Micromonospora deserti]